MNLFLIQHKNETLSPLIAISMWRLLQQISVLPVNAAVYRHSFNQLRYITAEQPNFVQIPRYPTSFCIFSVSFGVKSLVGLSAAMHAIDLSFLGKTAEEEFVDP